MDHEPITSECGENIISNINTDIERWVSSPQTIISLFTLPQLATYASEGWWTEMFTGLPHGTGHQP